MEENCFYCKSEVLPNDIHLVSFFREDEEQEEVLCAHCYHDWLAGMKG